MAEFQIISPQCSANKKLQNCQSVAQVNSVFFKMSFLVCLCDTCQKYFHLDKTCSPGSEDKDFTAIAKNFWDSFDDTLPGVTPRSSSSNG